MTTALVTQLGYVVAAGLFIFGLKMLGSPATARRGNMVSAIGMLVAIVAALLDQGIVDFTWIVAGMLVGGAIGAIAARAVAMTSMPEMVALFNGLGGARFTACGLVSAVTGCRRLHAGHYCALNFDWWRDAHRFFGRVWQVI